MSSRRPDPHDGHRPTAGYPEGLETVLAVDGGATVILRPIRPDDAPAEDRFIRRISPRSSYYRFFGHRGPLTPRELHYFTTVDYDRRMAFVALADGEMVAVGRYDVLDDEDAGGDRTAEVAFLVQDEFQGRGIGTQLLRQLAAYGSQRRITTFRADVLAENRTMVKLLQDSGYRLLGHAEGVATFEAAIAAPPSDPAG